jgi:chemotaxis protein MotA
MNSFAKGLAPIMAVEISRRAVPGHVRPKFQELENLCRGKGSASAETAAAASAA